MQVSFHGSFTSGMASSSDHHAGVPNYQPCHSSHVSTSERGFQQVVLYTSFGVWLHLRLSKGHPPPRQRSIRGPSLSTLRATLRKTLTMSSAATPASIPRVTSTADLGAGSGVSS